MMNGIQALAAKWERYAVDNYDDASNARSRCADELKEMAAKVAELIAYADSALHYVDEAAKAERARHIANGAAGSLVLAQEVADRFRASIAAVSEVK